MAECRLGAIEGHEQIVGLLLLEQKQQIAREAIHGRHRLAARAGHFRDRVEHLKNQRIGIHHPDRLAGQCGRFGGRCCRGRRRRRRLGSCAAAAAGIAGSGRGSSCMPGNID